MRKIFIGMIGGIALIVWTVIFSQATYLYVDAAPNIYADSDAYDTWWEQTKRRIVKDNFVDMRNSSNKKNKRTTNFEIEDAVVYNFGDGGSRLTFVYWLPYETIESLESQNFQISMQYFWDEEKYSFTKEVAGKNWIEPSAWEEYDYKGVSGVFGTAGFAWEGAYYTHTQEELDADLAYFDTMQGDVIFKTRRTLESGAKENTKLRAYHEPSAPVPEPSTVLLMAAGVVGIIGYKARRRK